MSQYDSDMEKEKIALAGLVIVVIIAFSVFLYVNYGEDLFKGPETIEYGDCVDLHYICKYASNNTVFESSYDDIESKTGGNIIQLFVTRNSSEYPAVEEYAYNYSAFLGQDYVKGLVDGLVGLKEGETATIGPIDPEDAYGLRPKVGDVLDLSFMSTTGSDYKLKIIKIEENAEVPDDFKMYSTSNTTTVYTFRIDSYYVGQLLPEDLDSYPSWTNDSVVTKINETKIWTYTTPSTDIDESFTWIEIDQATGYTTIYPELSTVVKDIDENNITIKHSPSIGENITLSLGVQGSVLYQVQNLTDTKINTTYTNPYTGNESYLEFDRIETIQRNNTQNITTILTEEFLDLFLKQLRAINPDSSKLSLSQMADEEVLFEVEIKEVYKNCDQVEES